MRLCSPPFGLLLSALLLPAVAGALVGCRLVDQRSFDPAAPGSFAMRSTVGPSVPPTPALITIRYTTPDPDYANALKVAVDAARRRKPDVLFHVETVVPASGSPDEQVQAARLASTSGRAVADAIAADGADVGQIELAAAADPAVKVREVRVYVH